MIFTMTNHKHMLDSIKEILNYTKTLGFLLPTTVAKITTLTIRKFHLIWHVSGRFLQFSSNLHSKSKAIPITGCGGLQSCKMLRIPHCLDNRLTDGGKVVSSTHQPLLYSPETLFLCFWYSFLLEADKPQGLVWPERLGKLKNHSPHRGLEPATFRFVT
jgi:hypothetical protein